MPAEHHAVLLLCEDFLDLLVFGGCKFGRPQVCPGPGLTLYLGDCRAQVSDLTAIFVRLF